MNTKPNTLLTELDALAQKHGWTHLMILTDEIRAAGSTHRIVVAAPSDTDISSFESWAGTVASDVTVVPLTLEELSFNPTPIITAEKPIAVFECGRLMEADAVAVVVNTFLSRPAGSYAIVMSHAERIETEEDLDLIERSIQRLLLSSSMSEWKEQHLLEHGIYLWSNARPIEWLESRLQRDKDALITWLRTPVSGDSSLVNALMQYRALYALDVAENELNREELVRTSDTPIDPSQRIYKVRQSIGELRLQLMRQVDTSTASIERTLLTSLQTLQADLLGGLHTFIIQNRELTSQGEDVFRRIIAQYIANGARSWQSRAERLLMSSDAYGVADTEVIVQGIDWSLINQLAAQHGKAASYPYALLEALMRKMPGISPELNVGQGQSGPRMTVTSQGIGSQLSLADVLRIVIGGGVASSAALLLGLGPIGAVASGVVGAVGIEMLSLRRRSGNRAEDYEQYGRELILHAMREASLRVQERVQGNRQALRQALKNELDIVEALLDQALHESRSPQANNPFPTERQRLQEYRRKLTANDSQAL